MSVPCFEFDVPSVCFNPGPRELWLGFGGANGAHHGAEAHHELLTKTSTP